MSRLIQQHSSSECVYTGVTGSQCGVYFFSIKNTHTCRNANKLYSIHLYSADKNHWCMISVIYHQCLCFVSLLAGIYFGTAGVFFFRLLIYLVVGVITVRDADSVIPFGNGYVTAGFLYCSDSLYR